MRKLLIVALILGGVVLAMVPVVTGCHDRRTARKLSELERFLSHSDPTTREWAAGELLDAFPSRSDELRLIHADALVALGRWNQARVVLEGIGDVVDEPERRRALELQLDSYMREVAWILGRTKPEQSEAVGVRVEQLLSRAVGVREGLEELAGTQLLVLKQLAREIDARASLLRLQLVGPAAAYAKARAANVRERMGLLGETVRDMRTRIRTLDNRLVQSCVRAIELDEQDPEPREILFLMWLKSGGFNQARRMAEDLCERDKVDPGLAGRFAGALLDLEDSYSVSVTERDVRIAQRLVTHDGLGPVVPIELELARVRLALRQGKADRAEDLARGLLGRYPKHAGATCLLGQALGELDRAPEAVELLDEIFEKNASVQVRYALGRALVAAGRERRGRELIVQSLEDQPNHLSGRLMLAQSMVDTGHVLEAKSYIREAVDLNPAHPRVRGLHARLLVEQLDRAGVRGLMVDYLSDPLTELGWRDACIAAAMVLDDRDTVVRLSRGGEGLTAQFAMGWIDAPRLNRFETAAIVARAILGAIDKPLGLGVDSMGPFGGAGDSGEGEVDPLSGCLYVPWPSVSALEMVEAGLLRWPDEPWLLDLSGRLWLWLGDPDRAECRLSELAGLTGEMSPTAKWVLAYLEGEAGSVLEAVVLGDATVGWVRVASALDGGDYEGAGEVLKEMLANHHWPEQALLMAMSRAVRAEQVDWAEQYLEIADRLNPPLGRLARSRYRLAQGRPVDAVFDAKLLVRGEPTESELRRMVSEVLGRANSAIGHVELAVGMFESLALAPHDQQLRMRLAAVDLLIDADRGSTAGVVLDSMLSQPGWSQRELDMVLGRALGVMRPERFEKHLAGLALSRPDDPVVLFYRARDLTRRGVLDIAESLFRELLQSQPHSVRVLVELAGVIEAQGRVGEARDLLARFRDHGGLAGEVASDRLERLGGVVETGG